jgi:predicted transcriptional regulator
MFRGYNVDKGSMETSKQYAAREAIRKALENRVKQASAKPVLRMAGETVKVTKEELLASLDALYGERG